MKKRLICCYAVPLLLNFLLIQLTFTTHWAKLAEDKLVIYFSPENRLWRKVLTLSFRKSKKKKKKNILECSPVKFLPSMLSVKQAPISYFQYPLLVRLYRHEKTPDFPSAKKTECAARLLVQTNANYTLISLQAQYVYEFMKIRFTKLGRPMKSADSGASNHVP